MFGFVREKVSKNKIRFRDEQEKFDLDLTYITPRIIAMGFPSSDMEGLYRNPIGEVYRFFELRHKDNYKLYNLCAERDYDHNKFHGRVSRYPFEDHNAPPIDLIVQCCADIHNWLAEDENHVVGINCKAGKGRTGLIICCYLMHSKVVLDSDEAMLYYGSRRTKDGKGVTIASQQRYVRYYHQVLGMGGTPPEPRLLMLKSVRIHTIPDFAGDPYVIIISQNQEAHRSAPTPVPKKATSLDLVVEKPVHGDVKIQFCVKKGRSHQNTCHFWFSTAFVSPETNHMEMKKSEIDVANKDKKNAHFKPDFRLEAFFEPIDVPKKQKKSRKSDGAKVAASSSATGKDKKRGSKNGAVVEVAATNSDASSSAPTAATESSNTENNTSEPAAAVATPSKKPKKGVAITEPEKVGKVEKPAEKSESSSAEEKSEEEEKPKTSAVAFEDPTDAKANEESNSKEEAPAPAAVAAPGEGFAQRRKRAQSFYDTSSSDEGLSSSELEEKQMDAYFAVEEDEEAPTDEPPPSPKANGVAASPAPPAAASPSPPTSTPASPKSPKASKSNGHAAEPEDKKGKKDKKDKKPEKAPSTPASPEPAKKEKKKEKEKEKEKEKKK